MHAILDESLRRYPAADPDRVGMLGGSYGGYMATWLAGTTDRFKAICSERAVNNLISEEWAGHRPESRVTHGATHLEDPELYAHMSPIRFAADITTPMLIIHSEEDLRCPINQAEELFVALRLLGKEVEFHRVPAESHELSWSGSPIEPHRPRQPRAPARAHRDDTRAAPGARDLPADRGSVATYRQPRERHGVDARERRPGPARTDLHEPAPQRLQVHAGGWSDRACAPSRTAPTSWCRCRTTASGSPPISSSASSTCSCRRALRAERTQGGLGIGLTLVKRLVEMHGGSVEARSEGHGRGSTFVVRLPLLAQGARADGTPRARGTRPERALRILVVDDNRDAVESLAMLLQLTGHETHTAQDGEEAIAAAARLEPEVILLDIGLPRLNGYEVCRRIRQQAWAQETVIVALTGWGQDDDRQRSSEAGFDAHLVKPVDHAALLELLADASS